MSELPSQAQLAERFIEQMEPPQLAAVESYLYTSRAGVVAMFEGLRLEHDAESESIECLGRMVFALSADYVIDDILSAPFRRIDSLLLDGQLSPPEAFLGMIAEDSDIKVPPGTPPLTLPPPLRVIREKLEEASPADTRSENLWAASYGLAVYYSGEKSKDELDRDTNSALKGFALGLTPLRNLLRGESKSEFWKDYELFQEPLGPLTNSIIGHYIDRFYPELKPKPEKEDEPDERDATS